MAAAARTVVRLDAAEMKWGIVLKPEISGRALFLVGGFNDAAVSGLMFAF